MCVVGSSQNDGFPPVPEGMRGIGEKGLRQTETGIVPAGQPPQKEAGSGVPLFVACVICALGAISASSFAPVACLLVGFGALAAGSGRSWGVNVLVAAGTIVLSALAGAFWGVEGVGDALLAVAPALAVALLARAGKLGAGTACIVALAAWAAQLGLAEAVCMANGTNVTDQVVGLVANNRELFQAAGLSASDWNTVIWVVGLLWPAAYSTVAAALVVCAYAGGAFAAARLRDRGVDWPSFGEFDLPLWVVAVFVAAVAGFAAWFTRRELVGDAVLMVSGNVLLTVRYALAAQGLAVLMRLLGDREVPRWARVLAAVGGVYLEARFIVMSIVGLLDIWANFRRLERGSSDPVQGETKQD